MTIRLLGPPTVERDGTPVAGPRGHKAWGLLAYLALAESPPSRQRLVSLLFDEADDPRRALRWNLAELRRTLAGAVAVGGNPVTLTLAPGHDIDVRLLDVGRLLDRPTSNGDNGRVLGRGGRRPGPGGEVGVDVGAPTSGGRRPGPGGEVDLTAIGGELLEGMPFSDSPGFEAWLAAERHRVAADCRTLVYESALRLLAAGEPKLAARAAARAVELDPLDADHHVVLVTSLLRAGDGDGARQQAARCADLFRRELGVDPPPEVELAAQGPWPTPRPLPPPSPPASSGSASPTLEPTSSAPSAARPAPGASSPVAPAGSGGQVSAAAVRSYIDAGRASVSAGAVAAGIDQLRRAAAASASTGDDRLSGQAQLALASALIHSTGGRGAEVAALLHHALAATERTGDPSTAAAACRELGFLAVQLGHRHGAEQWLSRAEALCTDDQERAKVLGVRGMGLTDAAAYPAALDTLAESIDLARRVGSTRQEAWALSMVGRVHVVRGEPALAATVLDRALDMVRSQRWTAFLPWPEAYRGEAALAIGDRAAAADLLDHAWVLATETGDHCWIVTVAHGLARLAAADGDREQALRWCETGLQPRPWYLWPRARLLDAGCEIAAHHAPDRAGLWAAELAETAAGGAMRELTARAQRHRSSVGELTAARTAAADIDNPSLHLLLTTPIERT